MDFEWEKLINGESDIDADDINALADGITENEKEIKAIKDIMDNGGTIPEYLTNFFKEIPDGLSIDDLCGYKYIGCYLVEETKNVYGLDCDVKYLLFVNTGVFVNNEVQRDEGHIFQTRYYFDAHNGIVKIQTRMDMYNEAVGLWEDWQDVFATPQYVNEQIAKIPTGGGGSEFKLLTEITADGETMYWTITKDADGNDINVHEIYMEINHADESGYQSIWINGKQVFVRQKVSKGYVEPIYISLQSNLLSGIVGRHSAGVNTSNTIFNSKIVAYKSINEIKTGGYGTSVLPVGTTIKIYAR